MVEAVPPKAKSVPLPHLGKIAIKASYQWGNSSKFTLDVQIAAGLLPSSASKHQEGATLVGSLKYALETPGGGSWALHGELHGLYASAIWSFFDSNSAKSVVPLIDSIEIHSLTVDYTYDKSTLTGSHCSINGILFIGKLQLKVTFTYDQRWSFITTLQASNSEDTLEPVIRNTIGDDTIELPAFIANMTLDDSDKLSLSIKSEPAVSATDSSTTTIATSTTSSPAITPSEPDASTTVDSTTGQVAKPSSAPTSYIFAADITIKNLKLDFAQYRSSDWISKTPSKRVFKVAVTGLPKVDVPLIGNVTQPFDEMYYLWVQDTSGKYPIPPGKSEITPGLTRAEKVILQPYVGIVVKDNNQLKKDTDVLVLTGSHFVVVVKGNGGEPTCILDYDFRKAQTEGKVVDSSATPSTKTGAVV